MDYDAIIMVTPDKLPLLKISYAYLKENLGARNIYLIANKTLEKDILNLWQGEMLFLDEESIMSGLSIASIRNILQKKCDDDHRAGWFYQQFLKMAYSAVCKDKYYLVWDADTVPLHAINYFVDEKTPCFIVKREYYKEYFDTIGRLFQQKVGRLNPQISYIAENMMIHRDYMQEILAEIMSNESLSGNTFYEKILDAISPEVVSYTGFSEFETYGNYMDTLHPGVYAHRRLRTQRLGSFLFGTDPDREQLEWASKDYDIISFEEHGKQWLRKLTKRIYVRKCFSAKKMFDFFIGISNFCDYICGRPFARID